MDSKKANETILVVEDDPALLKLAIILLEDLGYGVKPFDNGERALEWVRGNPDQTFRVAISDLKMPGMDGVEFCRKLTQMRPSVGCVLMSGYGSDAMAAMAIDDKLYFLEKPFTEESLGGMVREVLGR